MRITLLAAGLAGALTAAQAALAGTVTVELQAFQSIPISAGPNGALLSYAPFDPEDGTLKRVDVSFVYTLQTTFLTAPNLAPSIIGATPVSYTTPVQIQTSFTSLLGGLSSTFGSLEVVNIEADGTGGDEVLLRPYSYAFSVTPPTPVNTAVGPIVSVGTGGLQFDPLTTEDFLPQFPAAPSLDRQSLLNVAVTSLDPNRVTPLPITLGGAMLLTYVYDRTIPVHDPPVDGPDDPGGPEDPTDAVVPLPASALLLLSAVAAVGTFGRSTLRRKA